MQNAANATINRISFVETNTAWIIIVKIAGLQNTKQKEMVSICLYQDKINQVIVIRYADKLYSNRQFLVKLIHFLFIFFSYYIYYNTLKKNLGF